MRVLLRISRFLDFPAKKKSRLLIASKSISANKWEVLHYSKGYGMIALIKVSLTIFNMLENSRIDSF